MILKRQRQGDSTKEKKELRPKSEQQTPVAWINFQPGTSSSSLVTFTQRPSPVTAFPLCSSQPGPTHTLSSSAVMIALSHTLLICCRHRPLTLISSAVVIILLHTGLLGCHHHPLTHWSPRVSSSSSLLCADVQYWMTGQKQARSECSTTLSFKLVTVFLIDFSLTLSECYHYAFVKDHCINI